MSGPADSLYLPEPRRGWPGAGPLEPGAERRDEFEVTGPLLTDVGGTIGVGTHQRRVVTVPKADG